MHATRLAVIFLALAICASPQAPRNRPAKKKLLAIGASQGFQHDSVPYALGTLWKLGNETGLWETYIRTDTELITKQASGQNNRKSLLDFDAVYFYTSGELDLSDQQKADLLSFVRDDGKGFIGGHSAADTFYTWPEYGEMVGAYFDLHPWHTRVRINVEDRTFPATAHFPPQIEVMDEIYQFREPYSRDKVRVLMSLDPSSVDLKASGVKRTDQDWALVWVRDYGNGRVFYNALGHEKRIYDRPDMRRLFIQGIKWAMGMIPGDATPRPKPAM